VEKAVENLVFWRFMCVLSLFFAVFDKAKPRKALKNGLRRPSAVFSAINSPLDLGEGLPKAGFVKK
jgi:hypothetical protein